MSENLERYFLALFGAALVFVSGASWGVDEILSLVVGVSGALVIMGATWRARRRD